MKQKAILVLIIVLMVIAVIGISGCTSNAKTYNANGISFNYSNTWDEVPISEINTESPGRIPDIAAVGDYSTKHTFVTVQCAAADKSLAEYNDWNKAILEKDGNVQNITEGSLTVDGVPAIQLTYSYTSESNNVKKESMTAFLKNGKIYCVELSTPAADYDNQQNNLNMILNSFHIQ